MSWSLLLLPLLGGYYFLSRCIKWKYFYRRIERQRLIFDSLLVSFIFFLSSYIIWFSLRSIFPYEVEHFILFTGISVQFFFPALLSFIIAFLHTKLFNSVKKDDENWYLAEVIRKTGNSLQIDFLRSYFLEEIVMMTLKNGKVYVGLVSELHEPHPDSSYVRLILFYSGYRNEKMDVNLEKDYNLNIYSDESEDIDLVSVVISEPEILSMTFYNQDVYDRLNSEN
jgi:hypothetical protein